jgi:hypothetical protein
MNLLLEALLNSLLQVPWFGRDKSSLLQPASPVQTRRQQGAVRTWAQAHGLTNVDRDTWTGAVGRFAVELHTFLRASGALSMRLSVDGVPTEHDLPQVRGASTCSPLFDEVEALECIRARAQGVEFSLRWDASPDLLTLILERLEEQHQAAQASYR